MSDQLELWKVPAPRPANQRLFVALFPDDPSARLIHGLAGDLRQRHGLTGKVRPLSHLHITLRWINDYVDIPPGTEADVRRACEAIAARAAPFDITLDRVVVWGKGLSNHPVVLTGHGDGTDALLEFQHALWKELVLGGQPGKGGRDFNPHVTLLYDQRSLPEESVSPISWTVNDLVLVHSEVGATKYRECGRWKLQG